MRTYGTVLTVILCICTVCFTAPGYTQTHRKLIIASTSDLASIAQFIAGENYQAISVMEGGGNPSFIIPSQVAVLRAKKAVLYFNFGNQLETVWESSFFSDANASNIAPYSDNYHSVTDGITILPTQSADASVAPLLHKEGNPYVWLDPINCKKIAQNIAVILTTQYPSDQALFTANKERFNQEIDTYIDRINKRLAPYQNKKIVAFDHSFDYFTRRFGFTIVEYVQPAPGVIPNTKRIAAVAAAMDAQNVHTMLVPDYLSQRFVQQLQTHTTVKEIALPVCGGNDWATDYFKFLNQFTQALVNGLQSAESSKKE